ncbi:glycosyltransferase family 4 protein [Francisella philomiragia]|uniref:Glycosyl transferase, group 1 n=1 Tax=Francisella philomiragia subsp. philomiragia (strain ATCC 25017 / CCUG 19701 / FSC 153 / O\|nr:glycosyltransferase family 1 protein [Francisella philomiragia]AJI47693.1 glycosyl transferases group 1 family protein [Francisella philomiragia]AJI49874.1 glycosyl transferases group 1 family protein [Francisella philomiragia]MBK2019857.1 glycosyltransferase family 4 protein [Francisella philomiragia]MBK2029692.1 glycosyltransferase family 4 protein [Francisella philomiragia]MBK2264065.1 glycosyltransferase family 4 protein [Francisella philomiragia]
MKILYDHQIFTEQKYGGISRYFYELIREFHQQKNIDFDVSLFLSNNYYISDKEYADYINFLPNTKFKGKWRIYNTFNKIKTINLLKKNEFDVFHPTYYDPYFLKYIGNKPYVLTIHDMIHEKFSDMFSLNDTVRRNKKLLVEKAIKIIAISENTKKDLIDLLKVDENKIEVIYHGNSLAFNKDISESSNMYIPEKYILFVGERRIYKNFDFFIESVTPILTKNKDLFIVCAGGLEFNKKDLEKFSQAGILNQIIQYNIDDNSLAYLYNNALMFIFPSLYEGFGIPILEAFACDCPVLCSNTSSLPEVAGDAALYFDPYSMESIKNTVEYALSNKKVREDLIVKGQDRLKKFNWNKTAYLTKKLYESIL